jgi:integrase
MRKDIARFGPSRRTVRVFTETDRIIVQWYHLGRPKRRSWANTPAGRQDAKAWARGFAEARELPAPDEAPLTLRDIWTRYTEAEFPHLRKNSKRIYAEYWRKWERMWGREFVAEHTTKDMAPQFRAALEKQGLSVASVRQAIRTAKLVYRWAEDNDHLERNALERYRFKVAKDKRPVSPAEFTGAEFLALLAQFRPDLDSQWRPYVALALCGLQGVRQNAVLHLQWADVDLEAGRVTWRAEWDKLGNTWSQPLRPASRVALEHALAWREKHKRNDPWVFPAGSSKSTQPTYSIQSLWAALQRAERKAGIAHQARRGGHGLRRLLSGDVWEATGDAMLALRAIGDRDPRQMDRYLKDRDDRVDSAFAKLDESR